MQRTTVSSSNVAAVGYDEKTQTLEVEFTSGAVYQYDKVPKLTYEQFLLASSPGRFFLEYVRSNYEYRRV